jgi:hypothetical protein
VGGASAVVAAGASALGAGAALGTGGGVGGTDRTAAGFGGALASGDDGLGELCGEAFGGTFVAAWVT